MFTDRLQVTLSVTLGGTAHTIPSGNVKGFELDVTTYGFSGAVEFVVFDDKDHGGQETDAVLADFVKQDLVEVSLTVKAVHADPEEAEAILPVSVQGLGTSKSVQESFTRIEDRPILWRRYRIAFADPARVLWGQHFPCELYTQKSMKDVVDVHKGDKITITYDWTAFTTATRLLFLNLEPRHGASFYDFLVWYADARAGVLSYDPTANSYALTAAKDASGTAVKLFGDDVEQVTVVYPELARYTRNVLNSYTEATANKPVANATAATGIRQDVLLRAPIAQSVDDRVTLETSRLVLRASELELVFRRYPTVSFGTGSLVDFVAGNLWTTGSLPLGQTWRVWEHRIRAVASDPRPDAEHNGASAGYDVEVTARLEQKAETHVKLPSFTAPRYPGYVEGKVVSEKGEDADITYQYYTDEDTSLDEYKVKVPLWADQIVMASYDAHQGSGSMYVPVYKNARVLLALELEHAFVHRLIDWRPGIRLDLDAQGEQLVFGKQATNQTSVSHVYESDKPVFNIARTNDKDKGTIQIKEGVLTIQVKEDA